MEITTGVTNIRLRREGGGPLERSLVSGIIIAGSQEEHGNPFARRVIKSSDCRPIQNVEVERGAETNNERKYKCAQ